MTMRLAWLAVPAALLFSNVAFAATKSRAAAEASLPADTEIVATSNFKALRSTQTFQKLFPQLLKADKDTKEGITKITKTCGFDPLTSVDDVTMGLAAKEQGAFFLSVVASVTEKKLVECATKLAKEEKETLTATKTGNITELKSDKGSSVFFSMTSDNVLVVATDPEEKALLEKMLGGKGALAKSKVGKRLSKLRDDAVLSVVFAKEETIENLTVKGGDLTLAVKAGVVDLTTTVEMASKKEAEQVVTFVKAVNVIPLPKDAPKEAERILKTVDAKSQGADATVTASAAEKDLVPVATWLMGRFFLPGR
jgi:hypothetical protein